MAVRSTNITIKNRSDLQFIVSGPGTTLEHGIWSAGLAPEPGALVLESMDLTLQSESDGVATGTEGVVLLTTTIPGARPLEFYWDNPFVGGNEYLIRQTPGGLDVWYEGGVGDNAAVILNIAPTREVSTSFLPSVNGWKFTNSWPAVPNRVINLGLFGIPIGNASDGMCGGMVWAAIDYFMAGRSIPPLATAPPNLQDPYFNFVAERLYDSFELPMGPVNTYIPYMSAQFPADKRPYVTIKEAIPRIRACIAQGQPAPLGLIGAISDNIIADLGKNHQVLAYSYKRDGPWVTLGIYDPNRALADDCFIAINAESLGMLDIRHNVALGTGNIFMFFVSNYQPPVLPLP